MSRVTRTVRFTREEATLIDRFLRQNPVFDFSTLARVALLKFVKNPNLEIHAVKVRTRVAGTQVRGGNHG